MIGNLVSFGEGARKIMEMSISGSLAVKSHGGDETPGCVYPEIGGPSIVGEVRGTVQHADLFGSTNPAVALEFSLFQKANHTEA